MYEAAADANEAQAHRETGALRANLLKQAAKWRRTATRLRTRNQGEEPK
jgi:hypothetical protein